MSYPIKIQREPEIPALLAHGFPLGLLHQFIVKVNTGHHVRCKSDHIDNIVLTQVINNKYM